MASSSSSYSVILESKYDVYLSFRAEDTFHNFTSHLYAALCRKQILTFVGDDGLTRSGDEVSPALLKAIEDSQISVVIFSKGYASSTSCLDELAKIIECKKICGQIVVPVFYRINPSEVLYQRGSFKEAFDKHDERFKKMPERVQMWRASLAEAANLSGYHGMENRSESELVEEIARDIWKKLIDISPLSDNCDGLVGIDTRTEQINSLLLDSKVVEIWGIGVIVKTTIAEALFNRISGYFDCHGFINVGNQLEKHHDRLIDLQWEIVSIILGEGNHVTGILSTTPRLTNERLRGKKILVVLDDVNDYRHLKLLIRGLEPLHAESRVIIITRDKQVLSCCEVNHIYEVGGLNYDEACLLFCKCAFKKNHAAEHLEQLSNIIVSCSRVSPLALQVCLPSDLGFFSSDFRYIHWNEYPLKKLPSKFSAENLVDLEVRYSKFQMLQGEAKRFANLKSDIVTYPKHLIELPNLQYACKLETIKLVGCKRFFKVPSYIQCFTNLSYLCMRGCEYLRNFPRTIHFQSPIALNFSFCINLTEFPKVSGNVKRLSLGWTGVENVPTSIECLTKLVTLYMPSCKELKSISPSICKLSSLSDLDLVDCPKLDSFPEIMEEMKHLKNLNLARTAIKELPSSIERLVGLTSLNLMMCEDLQSIPSSISNLLYLEHLCVTRTPVSQVPACGKVMHDICLNLVTLDLSGHDFETLPASIEQLSKLRIFWLNNCNMLQSIPELPLRITDLNVKNCKQIRSLPQLPSNIKQFDGEESPPVYIIRFNFENCLNLTETISQRRVEHMASALGLFYEKVLDEIPEFYFFLPGSEIPQWFNHQSSGSSITIELPRQYCGNRRLIGFALSAVIEGKKHHFRADMSIDCNYSYANDKKFVPIAFFTSHSIKTDHVGISFVPAMDTLLGVHSTTVTFKFSVGGVHEEILKLFKLKCCGLCPIYEVPKMAQSSSCIERFASVHEDIVETISVDSFDASGSEDGRFSDEEVELHPKRNCINQINSSVMGGLLLSLVGFFLVTNFGKQRKQAKS